MRSELVDSHVLELTVFLVLLDWTRNPKGWLSRQKLFSNDWRRDKIEVAEMAANGLLLSNTLGIRSSAWRFGNFGILYQVS